MSALRGRRGDPRKEELDRLWASASTRSSSAIRDPAPSDAWTRRHQSSASFAQSEWPHRFIAGGDAIDWPTSPAWGQRLVTDAKIRQLVARLVTARRAGQKVVVFSQFSDTIAYIQSVLGACSRFSRTDWQVVVRGLGVEHLRSEELTRLMDVTTTITGGTEDRDEVVNAFAPYYRIGPNRPTASDGDGERRLLDDSWEASWTGALHRPIDVLFDRRPRRRRQSAGRRAPHQLRRPLEPGEDDPAGGSYRPAPEPTYRARPRASPISSRWPRASPVPCRATTGTTIPTSRRSR